MNITPAQRNEFVDAYTKALLTAWSDDDFSARLDSDPRGAFAQVGLVLPEDARIEVTRGDSDSTAAAQSQEARLERQIDLYREGLTTGTFRFHIPATPQLDTEELDMSELEGVAGGLASCCCPCCCCG